MAARSTASPINVNFPDAGDPGLAGRIGLTSAPGKRDGFTNRDLDADLARLREEYRCDLLVSLMELPEYEWLGIPDLFERATAHGIETVHFPIEDAGTPQPDAMPRFAEVISRIVGEVRAGRTAVIHCRGGLGRTGMVAASCLVALGREPADAIERVRRARPGAVETPEQERGVESFAKSARPPAGD